MNAKKVPQLFVATGATKWGDPQNFPWTMGWQPNYQSEGRIYAAYILKNYPNGKIAALWQNDDAGKDQMKGVRDGLGEKAGMIIADKSYEVSDPTIDSQIVALKDSGADIFMTWAAPKGAAQAIRKVGNLAGSRCISSATCRHRSPRFSSRPASTMPRASSRLPI